MQRRYAIHTYVQMEKYFYPQTHIYESSAFRQIDPSSLRRYLMARSLRIEKGRELMAARVSLPTCGKSR